MTQRPFIFETCKTKDGYAVIYLDGPSVYEQEHPARVAYQPTENGPGRLYYKTRREQSWRHIDEGQVINTIERNTIDFMVFRANSATAIEKAALKDIPS